MIKISNHVETRTQCDSGKTHYITPPNSWKTRLFWGDTAMLSGWANMTGPTCALALEGFDLRQVTAEYVLYTQLP